MGSRIFVSYYIGMDICDSYIIELSISTLEPEVLPISSCMGEQIRGERRMAKSQKAGVTNATV